MPLHSGKGQKVISGNIREMLHKFKDAGSIGHTHPKSMAKARKIAAAAAYRKSRDSFSADIQSRSLK